MKTSENINELATALAKAQSKIEAAPKDSANPFFKSHYADLSSVWGACRGPLTENGLAIVQTADSAEGTVDITTRLLHSSGQWIEGTLRLAPTKNDPQGFGSAITYGRRYGLAAIVGIVADEDDDGNAASAPGKKPDQKTKPAAKPEPAKELAPEQSEFNAWVKPILDAGTFKADYVREVVKQNNGDYAAARKEIEGTMALNQGAKA